MNLYFKLYFLIPSIKKNRVNDNLRYIDWTEKKASTKTFTIDDLLNLLASGKLFGRKFNERIYNAIVEELDKQKE